jgi:hypothetical protein
MPMRPVVFFRNYADPSRPLGWIVLAPYTDCPAPAGYERDGADTLPQIDKLQTLLEAQERAERSADLLHEETVMGPRRDEIRAKLYARMISTDCPQYEKEFLQAYLSHRIDRRARWHAKYMEFQMYFAAREFDTPRDRDPAQETVNVDRIG